MLGIAVVRNFLDLTVHLYVLCVWSDMLLVLSLFTVKCVFFFSFLLYCRENAFLYRFFTAYYNNWCPK